MLRNNVIIIFIFFALNGNSQEYQETYNVQMEKSPSGVYLIPCEVNELKMKFILDSGASLVSISLSEAEFMFKHGYLKESDIIESTKMQIADGSIADGSVINIHSIKIGPSFWLYDVKAVVMMNQSAPLLLGQSVLSKLGKWSINNASKTFTFQPKMLTNSEVYETEEYIGEAQSKLKLVMGVIQAIGNDAEDRYCNDNGYYYSGNILNGKRYKSGRNILEIALTEKEGWYVSTVTTSCSGGSFGALEWFMKKLSSENININMQGEGIKEPYTSSIYDHLKSNKICNQYQWDFDYNSKAIIEFCTDGNQTILGYSFIAR